MVPESNLVRDPREPDWSSLKRAELLSRLPREAPEAVLETVRKLRREPLQAWCLLWYRSQDEQRGCLYLSDRAIAKKLGCTERSARRRVARLSELTLVDRLSGRRKGKRSANGSIRFLLVAGSAAARAPRFRWVGTDGAHFEWALEELASERSAGLQEAHRCEVSARSLESKCPAASLEVSGRGGPSVLPSSIIETPEAPRGSHALETEGPPGGKSRTGLLFSKLDPWPASGSGRFRELRRRLGSTWNRPRERRELLEQFLASLPMRALAGLFDALQEAAHSEPLSLLELWTRRPDALQRLSRDPRAFISSRLKGATSDEMGGRQLAEIETEIGLSVRSHVLREDLTRFLADRSSEWRAAFADSLQRRRARELALGPRGRSMGTRGACAWRRREAS